MNINAYGSLCRLHALRRRQRSCRWLTADVRISNLHVVAM